MVAPSNEPLARLPVEPGRPLAVSQLEISAKPSVRRAVRSALRLRLLESATPRRRWVPRTELHTIGSEAMGGAERAA